MALKIAKEVEIARQQGQPIVALESTIITHGMPYPDNINMAKQVEAVIRREGAIPATIAVMNGDLLVGLNDDQLISLASLKQVEKVSIRDLSMVVSQRFSGGTTVAATMWIAHQAGLKIFATGGIGGVHRGGHESFDVSSDLKALGSLPVVVISAGAKAILDLGKTIEYLETESVPVIGYKTDVFPAFYYNKTPFKLKYHTTSIATLAAIIHQQTTLKLAQGMLIVNPVPDALQMEASYIENVINQAIIEAETMKIKGYEMTPFLLSKIKDLSDGESLKTNIELVLNNAKVAAQISVELAKL